MEAKPQSHLNDRDRDVLREIVEAYLLDGQPVSSRQIAKRAASGLSAATIRNVMADLDELGLLTQPHTSAGRIPTPQGYHYFIDTLMTAEDPSPADRQLIESGLQSALGDGSELTGRASSLLSRLSQLIGIVVTPDLGATTLKRVEFVPLSERKVLCVAVSTCGFIENKLVELDEEPSRAELVRVSNYLTDNFTGLTLAEMRDRLVDMMAEERAQVDQLLRRAVELAEKGLPSLGVPALVVEGKESLLKQPELADLDRVRRMFDTFADRARLVSLLNRCLEGEGVRVVIGEESDLTSGLDFSLIARRYESADGSTGSISLFGPSRMEYARLIPLVDYLGDRLSAALSRTM